VSYGVFLAVLTAAFVLRRWLVIAPSRRASSSPTEAAQ
jgi:hypothetical protein